MRISSHIFHNQIAYVIRRAGENGRGEREHKNTPLDSDILREWEPDVGGPRRP